MHNMLARTLPSYLQGKLEAGEESLASSRPAEAQQLFDDVLETLEENDPVNPSFVKAYVMARGAVARAHRGSSEALDQVLRCRSYLEKWDGPSGLNCLWVSLMAGQVQRLLGREKAAQSDLEKLWKRLKASEGQARPAMHSLMMTTAQELAALGAPRQDAELPPPLPHYPLPSALVDAVFYPRYQHRLRIGPVEMKDGTYSGADGSKAWFNPRSQSDCKILMGQPTDVLETDDPIVLASIGEDRYRPHNQFVIYQPWREPVNNSTTRLVGAMMPEMAKPMGESLANSPVKHFFMITGGVFRGALGAFKEGLNGHRLETLGIVWHFTGDDITDVPTIVEEIADLCQACGVEKLSLLTSAFEPRVEKRMVTSFAKVISLRECSVFRKDSSCIYPVIKTPKVNELLVLRK
jgi:hypothetical protein